MEILLKYLRRLIDIASFVSFDIIGKSSKGVRVTLRKVYDTCVINK